MARYERDIELQLPAEEVEEELRRFREEMLLYPTVWKGEACFCADYRPYGLPPSSENFKRVYFFSPYYENGVLHMESWMREGNNKALRWLSVPFGLWVIYEILGHLGMM